MPELNLGSQKATLAQVKELLCHHLQALWDTPAHAKLIPPLMLWGPPGVGKSALFQELCAEQGIGFIDVRLAQREPVDMRGLPVPRGEAVHWLPSAEWPREPSSRGIILFDELTAADRTLQVAAYEFILDRRLGDLYRVPNGWYVCAAGNRARDRAVAGTLSSALANRFCHLEVAPDLEGWVRWAQGKGLHPDVIAFLRFRPNLFFAMDGDLERGWPTPRSWERVALELKLAEATGLDPALLQLLIHGLVGQGAAIELRAFRQWAAKLPDVQAMLEGKIPVSIPQRADQRYALCGALVHHLWQGPAEGLKRRLAGFFRITEELPSDFAAMAMIDAVSGASVEETQQRSRRLFGHPGFAAWSQRHGAAFGERWAA
jgi:hypothetical protein